MKLSTRTRYGIRALLDLAKCYDEKPVSIKEIARRQNISVRYLENIFNELKNAGILGSVKGKGGGFFLAKQLSEITVLSLIDILEGELNIVDCLEDESICKNSTACYTRDMWENLNKAVRNSFSLVDLETVFKTLDK